MIGYFVATYILVGMMYQGFRWLNATPKERAELTDYIDSEARIVSRVNGLPVRVFFAIAIVWLTLGWPVFWVDDLCDGYKFAVRSIKNK